MGAPIKTEKSYGSAPSVTIFDGNGTSRKSISLDASIFARQINVPLMHQVVTAQLAARRLGTQSTKTRAEVNGGSAKPWRQKGTGRARQGSTRAPHFAGGGVALGPKPRSYVQKTPKKMVQASLYSALSDRAADNKIVVVDGLTFETPSTKNALAALKSWNVEGSALIVLGDDDENTYLSFRNVSRVHVLHIAELNTYDVLRSDYVVFTTETLPRSTNDEMPSTKVEAKSATEAKPMPSEKKIDETPEATQ